MHRPQEETSVSSQASTEKRYSVSVNVIAELHADMYEWPCIHPGTTIPYINLCLNLAANAKIKKRETEDDDEESTQTRMTSKQVCAV